MKIRRLAKDIAIVLLGNFILALGVGVFIIPFNILTGGSAGVAILLKVFIPLDTTTLVNGLVIGLFILGSLTLGKSFALKTIVSTVVFPLFLTILSRLHLQFELMPILASLYGGLLVGIGIGIVVRNGASTGGMDIPALIIHHYFRIPVSKVVFVIDALTVIFGLFIYGMQPVLLGLLSVFAVSFGIDKVMSFNARKVLAVQIISNEYTRINEAIIKELDRGATISDAKGGFTGEDKKVILVVVGHDEYQALLNLIHVIDRNAFVIASETNEVRGEGFSYGFRM
ncbi:YitT family protein [Erysipelotrichaceae bacterium OH741_COT-311]|nr:YitT family protein [Erysipelotrichaceae bacterium OH741_COT-311]